MRTVVQGFWEGKIGTMEKMCIQSYINHGHDFHLWCYRETRDVILRTAPRGVMLRDAELVVPQEKVKLFPWASIFSDFFRYALLRGGGWWVDMDTICLKPFNDLTLDYVFARDNLGHDDRYVTGFIMKAPRRSQIMQECYDWINKMQQEERDKLGHMDIGPNLLQRKVPELSLQSYIAAKATFDPIPWDRIKQIVDPEKTMELEAVCAESYVIHLRQSIWNGGPNSCAGVLVPATETAPQVLLRTDDKYPAGCLWNKLKEKLL